LILLLIILFVESKKIVSLPGLNVPINYSQYSDYITVDTTTGKRLHYWFIESSNKSNEDPLVLWLNGGPGCSSILGLLTENGPFRVKEDLSLEINPHSWNKVANIIWLESPAGVGYSYSDTPSDYNTDDEKTAKDSYEFLSQFFVQFPQFAKNDFYIAGESYAGHYIPQLALKVLQGNQNGNTFINLKGTLSGNPSTNNELDAQYYLPFLAQHALASLDDFQKAEIACGGNYVTNSSVACKQAINNIFVRITTRINPYNVYAPCVGLGPSSPGYCFTQNLLEGKLKSQTFIPCIDINSTRNYMNRQDVRKAIFVSDKVSYWDVCSQIINYSFGSGDMIPIYNQLVTKYRVLLYSGDVDSCVNYIGTQKSAELIKAPGTKGVWTAWMVQDQVGGYKIQLGDNLQYITIKNAGHMVPSYQPEAALSFFDRFIHNKPI